MRAFHVTALDLSGIILVRQLCQKGDRGRLVLELPAHLVAIRVPHVQFVSAETFDR
jgi:hypothetical protein